MSAVKQHPTGRLPKLAALSLSLLVAGLSLLASCGGETTPSEISSVPAGTWGGQGVRLNLTASTAVFEFDCASGQASAPFTVDANGHFDQPGTFVFEHGGPVRQGQPPDSHPARYSGTTDGHTMTLNIALTDTGQRVGTYSLTMGATPMIRKCL